ncbi:MAG: nitronate monooxygenase [Rhodospirillaceae bacterium]|nr:nitronate monooxygenase [Rhodospirillaceae bacterium]
MRPVFRTKLCDLLGIEYPIVLAGMGSRGKATPPALVAAVSNAGGLGVIGGSGLEPEQLRDAIRRTRELTDKPIGVDLILPGNIPKDTPLTRSEVRRQIEERYPEHAAFVRNIMTEHGFGPHPVDNEFVVANTTGADGSTPGSSNRNMLQQQVDVIMSEDVQVFAAGLGDPSWVTPLARERGMVMMGLAGSPRNAERQKQAGVDIIVAQGYEAGGHTGWIASLPLIPQVVDAVAPMPVLAAGGIVNGRGVAGALSLGAAGVWVGTAFLASEECDIHDEHKRQIAEGRSQDFDIRKVYTGKTMRSFKNAAIKAWDDAGLDTLPMPYQKILMDDFNSAAANRHELHSNPAGQGAGGITAIRPAAAIMEDLVTGAIAALNDVNAKVEI